MLNLVSLLFASTQVLSWKQYQELQLFPINSLHPIDPEKPREGFWLSAATPPNLLLFYFKIAFKIAPLTPFSWNNSKGMILILPQDIWANMPGDKVESPRCKATHVHPINGNWELGYLFIPYMCCIAKVSGKSRSLSIVCGLWWNSEVPEEAGLSYYHNLQSSSGTHCHQLSSHAIAQHIMQAWLCTPVISAR